MDAWSSPNHCAFDAVTVHFEHKGKLICLILDFVEVAKVSFSIWNKLDSWDSQDVSPIVA